MTQMDRLFILFIFIVWKQDPAWSIRLVDLRVPAHAAEGGTALLGCQFDLEGDELYSVKWYKNGREFYRYVPNNSVPTSHFPTSGITVDLTRSSSTVVALTDLRRESAGLYRCEVSGEAPKFATVYDEKYITIHYLPKTGPYILGLPERLEIGDRAALKCTSPGSQPEAQLKWLVNDKPVSKEHLQGPWYRISKERVNAMETILELRFTVMPKHFKKGVLSLKCQAVIAPLYQNEVVYQVPFSENAYSTIAPPLQPPEEELTPLFPSPVYNEIKHLGFPPIDEDETSEEARDTAMVLRSCIVTYLVVFILKLIIV